jgi:hypothetical protein
MRWSVLGSAGILLAADAVLLIGVAANRSSALGTLQVSERELTLPARAEENSALTLSLQWRDSVGRFPFATEWLDAAKLADLGFDVHSERPAAKLVFAVLELRPEAPEGTSRLLVIDAGLDPAPLRARYSDGRRYAVTRAVVRIVRDRRSGQAAARGWLSVLLNSIYVPTEYLPVFRGLPATTFPIQEPRYEAALCYGRAGEPWLCGAQRTGSVSSPAR